MKALFGAVVVSGDLELIDARGGRHRFGDGTGAGVTVRLHDPWLHWKLVVNPAFYIGEAYMDGTLTIERGSLRDFMTLVMKNMHRRAPASIAAADWLRWLKRRISQYNPIPRARANVAHHYDLDGALYELFLDADRQYSCAYFETPDATLEEAQEAKKRHIAAKLRVADGHRVLDIGSGWGGLALYLADLADVEVTGITLSNEQLAASRERAATAVQGRRVRFRLADYREVEETFDRIVSVGMFEHVGVGYYPAFFKQLAATLADDGVALLHTIGRFAGPGATNPWITKYIFPGGYAPALSEILPAIEKAGLIVTDVETLRLHYATTVQHWQARFAAARATAAAIYDERFCRMWEFYLVAAELTFRYQDIGIFQLQIVKDQEAVPLTRDYMFEWERERRGLEAPAEEAHRMAGE